jgi:adenylate kinase family enzyme
MRIAIIGLPGVGKTTLAQAIGGLLGVDPVDDLSKLDDSAADDSLILDGIPGSIAEWEQLVTDLGSRRLDHVLLLSTSLDLRVRRIGRLVSAGADAALERERLLAGRQREADLELLGDRIAETMPLTYFDTTDSRSDVLSRVLKVLGIGG